MDGVVAAIGDEVGKRTVPLVRKLRVRDGHTLAVAGSAGERIVRADSVVIAIGSSPVQPPQFPFAHNRVHDSDEVLNLVEVPKSMAVIGAGVIGSEYACTFAALE